MKVDTWWNQWSYGGIECVNLSLFFRTGTQLLKRLPRNCKIST